MQKPYKLRENKVALTFEEIINKYRENSTSERNKGDRFERLMKAYLLTKPVYKNLLSDVWLWSEFPYKDQFGIGGKDTGIDIVCRTHDGDYWAVQCKCYRPETKIDLHLVSTFITTASFPFNTKDGNKNLPHCMKHRFKQSRQKRTQQHEREERSE